MSESTPPGSWSRRSFVARSLAAGAAVSAVGLGGCRDDGTGSAAARLASDGRNLVPMAPELLPRDAVLRAAPGMRDLGRGVEAPLLLVNDTLPSPLLRVQRGETFSARMENRIEDPLVLHWHGLTAPEDMDGHTPASRFPPGPTTDYRFEVNDPAGTCWYHSHTHHMTGLHR